MAPGFFAVIVLIACASLASWLLRAAACPGSSILGGVAAGLILGPTILGRVAPVTYEQLYLGGIEARESLERVQRAQAADILAAIEAELPAEAIEDLRNDHQAALEPYVAALEASRWEAQAPMRWSVMALIALAMLAAAAKRVAPDAPASDRLAATNIGVWAAAVPGAIAYLAMTWWWGFGPVEAVMVSAAVMIGPWILTHVDREAADEAELGGARTVDLAGRFATLLALVAMGGAFWLAKGPGGLLWLLPLAALILVWLPGVTMPGAAHYLATRVLIPSIAAAAALRVDLFEHFMFWPLLILLILSGDGRWFGAVIGALLLGGRTTLRTMRLVLGVMACGPTQIAAVALVAQLGVLPGGLILALMAGAVVIEVSVPLRRKVAAQLLEAEAEWPKDQEP